MTRRSCVGEPISWMRLERFVLGEASEAEARSIEEHLMRCAVCRACADEARAPVALPDWSTIAPASMAPAVSTPVVLPLRPRPWPRRLAIATTSLAIAAAAMLVLRPRESVVREPGVVRVRGGDVAMLVVREREGATTEDPSDFRTSDRFRIALSCPPGLEGPIRIVVEQGGERALASSTGERFRCGNRAFLEGAFRITDATDARICAIVAEPGLAPEDPAFPASLDAAEAAGRCLRLRHAP